jgi:ATP-dependent DNA helicase RecG
MRLDKIPVIELKGVGAKMAEKLAKLNLVTVQDLLFHLPSRYQDRTTIYPIQDLLPGLHGTIEGNIVSCDVTFGKRKIMSCKVNDGTGIITLLFFHFSAGQKNSMAEGKTIKAFGEFRRGRFGYEIVHPEYKLINGQATDITEETLTPVYPSTDGLKQLTLRNLTDQALQHLAQGALKELLPPGLYAGQIELNQAITLLHRPTPDVSLELLELGQHPAQQRLIIEELLAQNISMLQLRQKMQTHPAIAHKPAPTLTDKFLAQLPFTPTNAQQRVVAEIQQDLHKTHPMMRLVQGDVGSGKTLVAALAALQAIGNGYQVALMAPTEILAEQHALNFKAWFNPLDIKVGWLSGKQKGKARETELADIASGATQMIVGTHAIFQDAVKFLNLTLVIIDEQHRFGVEQRLALREKGAVSGLYPHQLFMTATPIPRTLAMTAYADLNTSVIDELPPGRIPITTVAIPDTKRNQIIDRVQQSVKNEGRQVYWVCTLIEESEVLEAQAAEDTATALQNQLPELRIGLVHGRMKAIEKQYVMDAFKNQQLDLLVATTVIEVGVDVPNASLMIIENPERLGLAQLHQLRGRVGRGQVASHCVLLYHAPLSDAGSKRLSVLRETTDGFKIAQRDLEIRGPGEMLGNKQTGIADLKVADLVRDQQLIPLVQNIARHLHQHHPDNANAITQRWMANKEIYSNA